MAIGLLGLAVTVGVGIDLDHFIVSRVQTGDWRVLKRCFRNPSLLVFDQSAVFGEEELTALQRLLSHQLLGGAIVALGWWIRPVVGWLLLSVIYVHIVADLISDVRQQRVANHNR
ncbi:MAG: hypothetical protein ABEH65_05320 [Halobacteriales archaeon]